MQSVLQKKIRIFALDVAAHRVKNHLEPLENYFSPLQSATIYQIANQGIPCHSLFFFFVFISIRFVLCGRKMSCFNALFEM